MLLMAAPASSPSILAWAAEEGADSAEGQGKEEAEKGAEREQAL